MAELPTCPTRDELQQLILNRLPDSTTRTIQKHLVRCPECRIALEECVSSDALLEAVRTHCRGGGEPTKTLDLPVEWIRDALLTWIRTHDPTQMGENGPCVSTADLVRLLDPPQSPDEMGRIADFRVLRVLGAGGMAVVFEAEDSRLKRHVALKLMRPDVAAKTGGLDRFIREAQSAAKLKHEHVVTIYQVGMHGETPFIALERLHGESLEEHLLRSGRPNVREVVRIGREIALGLAAAHSRGLLHRDIKPANIWLEQLEPCERDYACRNSDPGSERATTNSAATSANGWHDAGKVKILDFGCAKTWSDDSGATQFGLLVGTPSYMAPEQLSGQPVDPRADLFSLGCVLYRMTTGKRPFTGDDLLAVVRALAVDEPAPARSLNPQVPSALSDLIGQLMSKSPNGRPESAQVVVQRLQAITDGLAAGNDVEVPVKGAVTPDAAGHRRGRFQWLAGSVIGLVILLPLGYLFGVQVTRIVTNKGRVVIKIDDPSIEVTVKENHIVIHDRPGQSEITLGAGEHQLEVTVKQPSGETTFNTDRFLLHRGGQKVIDVRADLAQSVAQRAVTKSIQPADGSRVAITEDQRPHAPAAFSLDRGAAKWVLSLGGKVTVRVSNQAKPVEVHSRQALPALDFELTDVSLQQRPLADARLAPLRGLTHLARLNLDGTQISDAGFGYAEGLAELRTLLLTNTKVTDAALEHIEEFPKLVGLWLDGTRVTDAGLAHLKSLKDLQILILNFTRVTGSGLDQLEDLPDFKILSLRGCHLTDADLVHLSGLVKLQTLNLSRLRMTDAGLVSLRPLTKLQYLVLDETRVTDAGLNHLTGLTHLNSLYLNETAVTDSGLSNLYELKFLSVVGLKGLSGVTDAAIPKLLHFRSLRDIDLRDSHVSAKGFAVLKTLRPHLNVVWSEPNYSAASAVLAAGGTVVLRLEGAAAERSITDIGELPAELFQVVRVHLIGSRETLDELIPLVANPRLKGLVSLDLSGNAINDADLARLESQRTLQELMLTGTRITDAGMVHLKSLSALRRLVLDGTGINGSGLNHLQLLPELAELRLGCPALTEISLAKLGGFKKLKRLSLAKSNISDEGVKYLVSLTHLTELDLSHTKVTDARVKELKASLPQCRIVTANSVGQIAKP